jgi:phosphomannomutase/phosphoglucomutase
LRVEYADGFGLARSSNTTPVIVLRFEADDVAALKRIQEEFRSVLRESKPGVQLPF